MTKICSKIGIGTAQWGMNYGISNTYGQTSRDQALKILETSKKFGIKLIDTAPSYGSSEEVLGSLDLSEFLAVTKTPHFNCTKFTSKEFDKLLNSFAKSLEKLNLTSVYCLHVHNANDLFCEGSCRLVELLVDLKRQKEVEKLEYQFTSHLRSSVF